MHNVTQIISWCTEMKNLIVFFKGKSLCTNLCWINSLEMVLLLRESCNSKNTLLRPFSSRMENIWESRILLEVCRASDRHFTKTLRNLLLNHTENCFWKTNGIMKPWSKHFTKLLLDNSIINKKSKIEVIYLMGAKSYYGYMNGLTKWPSIRSILESP